MRFRLLIGGHRKGALRDENGHVIEPGRNYKPGDIIESTVDLCTTFPSQPPKFLRIDEVAEKESQMVNVYQQMPLNELKDLAEQQEIDLTDVTSKEEIIALLAAQ
jgi:hypothetical protein